MPVNDWIIEIRYRARDTGSMSRLELSDICNAGVIIQAD